MNEEWQDALRREEQVHKDELERRRHVMIEHARLQHERAERERLQKFDEEKKKQEKLRKEFPALQAAWEAYELILKMVEASKQNETVST
jgi:hypothetical protein